VFNGSTNISDGSSSAINFGSVTAGGSDKEHLLSRDQPGRGTLSISKVTVPSGYTITDGLGGSISPGASDTLTIRLDSGSAGTRAAT